MAHIQTAGASAPVRQLPTAAAHPVAQTRRFGRLPGSVTNIATARRARATHQYNSKRTAAPAFASNSVVLAAFQYMERNTVGGQHRIGCPGDVGAYLRTRIGTRDHEVFTVLFLNTQNQILACEEMTKGTVSQCHVYPREVARRALQLNATSIIACHNHPSGSLKPSAADHTLTHALTTALAVLDIAVLDHIIVASTGAYSIKGECHV